MDKKQIIKNTIGWGLALWVIGYVLGIVLFAFVPANLIGWIILPIGTLITIWVLVKKVHRDKFQCYFGVAVIWTLIAVVFDYLFIVKAFKSVGYYKLDVYVYYALTFLLPIIVGWWKMKKEGKLSK